MKKLLIGFILSIFTLNADNSKLNDIDYDVLATDTCKRNAFIDYSVDLMNKIYTDIVSLDDQQNYKVTAAFYDLFLESTQHALKLELEGKKLSESEEISYEKYILAKFNGTCIQRNLLENYLEMGTSIINLNLVDSEEKIWRELSHKIRQVVYPSHTYQMTKIFHHTMPWLGHISSIQTKLQEMVDERID